MSGGGPGASADGRVPSCTATVPQAVGASSSSSSGAPASTSSVSTHQTTVTKAHIFEVQDAVLKGLKFDEAHEAKVLADGIEKHSASLAQALAQVTGSLHASLHDMAACTQEHMRVYDHALTSFADNVDQSVAAMTAFMEKVRKLNEDLRKMKALHAEIKAVLEVVHTLDAVTLKLVKAAKQRKK